MPDAHGVRRQHRRAVYSRVASLGKSHISRLAEPRVVTGHQSCAVASCHCRVIFCSHAGSGIDEGDKRHHYDATRYPPPLRNPPMSMACLANHVGSGLWVDASCSTHSVMTQHGRSMAPALRHHSDCPTHDSGRQTHMRVRGLGALSAASRISLTASRPNSSCLHFPSRALAVG